MRLVIDTNVWLDWLVFEAQELAELRAARQAGIARIVIDAPCLAELERVLTYPEFGLDAASIAAALDDVRLFTESFSGKCLLAQPLPRCQDPDDQKFLRLAAAARADCLVTRDRALLRLDRRTARAFGFAIREPGDWQRRRAQSKRLVDSDSGARAVR
jgi:putative PIN family toxin of toxin-antitoxin system